MKNPHTETRMPQDAGPVSPKNRPVALTSERRLKQPKVTQFDPDKLGIHFCPAAEAELIAKRLVLLDLRRRAKSAGKTIMGGTENIAGPQRCRDLLWLHRMLTKIRHEFGDSIDEHLKRLSQPGANHEMLAGRIYTDILCIRATITIFFGDQIAPPRE